MILILSNSVTTINKIKFLTNNSTFKVNFSEIVPDLMLRASLSPKVSQFRHQDYQVIIKTIFRFNKFGNNSNNPLFRYSRTKTVKTYLKLLLKIR